MDSSTNKTELRSHILALRRAQPNKDTLSREIRQRLVALPQFAAAKTVMFYVDARSEVRTRDLVEIALKRGKTVAIPYCNGDDLVPWPLTSLDELSPGAFGILEPPAELRDSPDRLIDPLAIDLIGVPAVAFDHHGNRLGSGRGYYDRLLPRLRANAIKIGLAYECQIVDEVPVEPHDVPMDVVITESNRGP